jgi:hypothetical protein
VYRVYQRMPRGTSESWQYKPLEIEPARRIALPSCPPVPFRHELLAGPNRLSRIASQDRAVDEGGALRPDVARRRGALVAEAVGKRWIVRALCRDLPRPPIMLTHPTILAPDGRRKRPPASRPRRAGTESRRSRGASRAIASRFRSSAACQNAGRSEGRRITSVPRQRRGPRVCGGKQRPGFSRPA